jgi:glycosyltransferase involved in cell wall biosynthesis
MTHNGRIPSRKADGVAVMNTCSQLASHGFDVELILPKGQAAPIDTLDRGHTIWDFYQIPQSFKITYFPCPFFCSIPRHAGYTIWAVSYAVIRGKSLIYARHLELAYLAALYGRVSIFESHNYLKVSRHPLLLYWIKLLRNPQRRAAMVVTTHAAARAYESRGVPLEKILVAPNGVDVKRFALSGSKESLRTSLGLPRDKTVVGFSGHLYKGRGIEALLECAKLMDQIFFIIVGGEPSDVRKCTALARQLSLGNVRFTGFVRQSEVPGYLLASDILIMPYTVDNPTYQYMSPMKMFDYLASGRPTVATDFPVVREILHHKQNAVLVPPGSARALATGIQWLLDHPESARRFGEQAEQDAKQYSWENRVRHIISWTKGKLDI